MPYPKGSNDPVPSQRVDCDRKRQSRINAARESNQHAGKAVLVDVVAHAHDERMVDMRLECFVQAAARDREPREVVPGTDDIRMFVAVAPLQDSQRFVVWFHDAPPGTIAAATQAKPAPGKAAEPDGKKPVDPDAPIDPF